MSKFLTFEDRLLIEKGLRENLSFGAIAKEISKDRTTVAKEVKKYAYDLKSGYSNYPYNACIHRVACKAKKICGVACTRPNSPIKCSICNKCNDHCPDFMEEVCQGRFKPPYVCNGFGDWYDWWKSIINNPFRRYQSDAGIPSSCEYFPICDRNI